MIRAETALFKAFDDAAESEAASARPANRRESMSRLACLIDLLPQRRVIKDRHAASWLERCRDMAERRIAIETEGMDVSDASSEGLVHDHVLWNVRRASAFGGSEAGTVLRHFRGETGGFTNARNLVLEKLLILSPVPGTEPMNRGVRAEPWIQRIFAERYGATSDTASLDALRGVRLEKLPCIVGTPDDVVVMPDGRRLLTDYKCPSADVCRQYQKDGIAFDYQAQLHHYALLAKAAGIPFDGLEDVCLDPERFVLHRFPVESSRELFVELIRSSSKLWYDHVMTGDVPDAPGPATLDTEDPDARKTMKILLLQAAILKLAEDEIGKRRKKMLARAISAVLDTSNATSLSEGKIDAGFATIGRSRTWDDNELHRLLKGTDLDSAEFSDPDPTKVDAAAAFEMLDLILATARNDPENLQETLGRVNEMIDAGEAFSQVRDLAKMARALEDAGVSTLSAAGINERFNISRAKAHANQVSELKGQAADLAGAVEQAVEIEVATMMSPPRHVEPHEEPVEP